MQPDIKKYLYDIKTSIDSINEFLGEERDFEKFRTNKMLKRAVEREFEIIGEAAGRIIKIDAGIKIDSARKIVDLRNWIIHGYDRVDDIIIWGIISKHLPQLKKQVEELL